MIRRIAIAILLTTWAALIAVGCGTYLLTRHVLLSDLDASIAARAQAVPDVAGVTASGSSNVPQGDRFIVRDSLNRTVARPTTLGTSVTPVVTSRQFTTLADGQRLRTLTVVITANDVKDGSRSSITIMYSSPADRFDALLNRLLFGLVAIDVLCGVVVAGVAVAVSRLSLRPLAATADVLGTINERRLDRRIDVALLPSELAPMAHRLNEMLARLEQAFKQRQRFMADASHELRTPVASIVTTIEVALRRPRENAALAESLRACLDDAKTLRELVEWLMLHVRSETPALSEPVQQFDAVELLKECADSVSRLADERVATIEKDLPARLDLTTQRLRLRSIVSNLLSNAVQYNRPGGKIVLRCQVNSEVEISVTDEGPGIAPALLPHVFEPFFRGQKQSPPGTNLGLGLSIVQVHAQAMNGRCEVESQLGTGTTFRLRLPRSVVAAEPKDELAAILK